MINYKLKLISLTAATLLFSGCGGGGSASLGSSSSTISGSVVDGPIYGATVQIIDKTTNKVLATDITSDQNGSIGDYSFTIENLPNEYIIKVTGGKDTGPDGIINDNDEASFEMSTIATKNDTKVYVSPATTLITNMVNDGLPLSDAKENIKKALGLPDGIDLTTTNPKKNELASKAGTIVAQIIKAIPSTDKIQSLKSVAKEFKAKVDSNKTVATISTNDIIVQDLNLTAIADDIKTSQPDAIIETDITKITKSETILKQNIKTTVKKIKAVDMQTDSDRKEALAAHKALEKLSEHIKSEDAQTLDTDKLQTLATKLENGFSEVLSNGIENLTENNLDIVSSIIEKNIDQNISSISTELKSIASTTKAIDSDVKDIVKNIYTNLDINQTSKVSNLNMADIKSLASEATQKSDTNTTKKLLEKSIASKIANIVQKSSSQIDSSTISQVKTETINNSSLVDTLKSIATKKEAIKEKKKKLKKGEKLSNEDLAQIQSSEIIMENISKNFKKDNFTFDNNAVTSLSSLEQKIKTEVQTVLGDNTKSSDDIFDTIKSIELSAKIIKLDEIFDGNKFDTNLNTIKTITSTARTQKNSNSNIDLSTTLKKIEEDLEEAIENNTSISDFATTISNDINKYIQQKETKKVEVTPLFLPNIGGFKLPELLDTNGSKIYL